MKRLTILYLLFLSLFISCKKSDDNPTKVNGVVYEQATNIPVSNALVKLVRLESSTYNTVETILDSVRTDSQGRYAFEEQIADENSYYIDYGVYVGEAKNYYVPYSVFHVDYNVHRGKTQTVNLNLIPYAWVKINCQKKWGNDLITINRIIGSNKSFGISTDSTIISQSYGNQEVEIPTFTYKSANQTGKKIYNLMTKGHDTTDITIFF